MRNILLVLCLLLVPTVSFAQDKKPYPKEVLEGKYVGAHSTIRTGISRLVLAHAGQEDTISTIHIALAATNPGHQLESISTCLQISRKSFSIGAQWDWGGKGFYIGPGLMVYKGYKQDHPAFVGVYVHATVSQKGFWASVRRGGAAFQGAGDIFDVAVGKSFKF